MAGHGHGQSHQAIYSTSRAIALIKPAQRGAAQYPALRNDLLGCQDILSWDSFGREVDEEGFSSPNDSITTHSSIQRSYQTLRIQSRALRSQKRATFGRIALYYLADALADHVNESDASRKIEIMAKGKPREVPIHGANLLRRIPSDFQAVTRDVERLLGVQTVPPSRRS
jgi:hypothetical protein